MWCQPDGPSVSLCPFYFKFLFQNFNDKSRIWWRRRWSSGAVRAQVLLTGGRWKIEREISFNQWRACYQNGGSPLAWPVQYLCELRLGWEGSRPLGFLFEKLSLGAASRSRRAAHKYQKEWQHQRAVGALVFCALPECGSDSSLFLCVSAASISLDERVVIGRRRQWPWPGRAPLAEGLARSRPTVCTARLGAWPRPTIYCQS